MALESLVLVRHLICRLFSFCLNLSLDFPCSCPVFPLKLFRILVSASVSPRPRTLPVSSLQPGYHYPSSPRNLPPPSLPSLSDSVSHCPPRPAPPSRVSPHLSRAHAAPPPTVNLSPAPVPSDRRGSHSGHLSYHHPVILVSGRGLCPTISVSRVAPPPHPDRPGVPPIARLCLICSSLSAGQHPCPPPVPVPVSRRCRSGPSPPLWWPLTCSPEDFPGPDAAALATVRVGRLLAKALLSAGSRGGRPGDEVGQTGLRGHWCEGASKDATLHPSLLCFFGLSGCVSPGGSAPGGTSGETALPPPPSLSWEVWATPWAHAPRLCPSPSSPAPSPPSTHLRAPQPSCVGHLSPTCSGYGRRGRGMAGGGGGPRWGLPTDQPGGGGAAEGPQAGGGLRGGGGAHSLALEDDSGRHLRRVTGGWGAHARSGGGQEPGLGAKTKPWSARGSNGT